MPIMEIATGEFDTQRSGFLPVRVSKLDELKQLAEKYDVPLLKDMAGKTEPQAEYAVVIGNVIYFTEVPK